MRTFILMERSGIKTFGIDETYLCQMIRLTQHKDRKSTRLNSSHVSISYAVFCLKKKTMGAVQSRGVAESNRTFVKSEGEVVGGGVFAAPLAAETSTLRDSKSLNCYNGEDANSIH